MHYGRNDSTSVSHERKGHARGLILGLTMAETMLLLVFCLLLMVGAIVARKQAELDRALNDLRASEQVHVKSEASARDLERKNKELLQNIKKMMEAGGHKVSDEEWRKLVASSEVIDRASQAGLSSELIQKIATELASRNDGKVETADVERMLEAEEVLAGKQAQIDDLNKKIDDLPPILDLSEADGYSFKVSSAELTPGFKAKLEGAVSEKIRYIVGRYDVDVVEVVGHTDEQRLSRQSNMDDVVGPLLAGRSKVGDMIPGDNAGLGLARALAVTAVLKSLPEFKGLNILPMSGGQLILPEDRLTDGANSGDAPERRRIEIRVRKSKAKLAQEGKKF